MKFPRLTPTQQIIVIAAVFVVITLLSVIFVLVPQLVGLQGLMAEEGKASQDLESAKATLKQLEDLKRGSQKTEAKLIQLNRKAPADAELPSLIIQMEDASNKAGVDFILIKPGTPVQKDEYQEIPLDIKINGYFYELLDFVYRVEKLPRLVDVITIDIKEGKAKLPNIEATLKANVYVLTPGVKPKTGAAEAPSPPTGGEGGSTPPTGGGTTGGAQ